MTTSRQLHYGKKPARYDARDILFADVRPRKLTLPSLPQGWGRGMDFGTGPPPAGWGMMGNGPCDDNSIDPSWAAYQGAGDCTCADPAHVERMNARDAGRPIPSFSTKTVLGQYSLLGGYDPQSGNNDNGLEIRQVLNYRQQQGFADDAGNRYKIGAYVALEPGNWQMLREACWLFPGISIGFQVPQSAEDQFNNGQNWSVVPGMMNSIVGGHDVPIVGHPWGGLWTAVSWAQRQVMTFDFFTATCDEVYAYIDPERYSAVTGKTYNGYQDADLEQYITLVGQQVSNQPKRSLVQRLLRR